MAPAVRELAALAIAYRDPRTPLGARAIIAAVLAYALSPIDLIPDFVPVVGILDDLVLLPIGAALALRLLPEDVLREARQAARATTLRELGRDLGRWGAVAVVLLWVAALMAIAMGLRQRL